MQEDRPLRDRSSIKQWWSGQLAGVTWREAVVGGMVVVPDATVIASLDRPRHVVELLVPSDHEGDFGFQDCCQLVGWRCAHSLSPTHSSLNW
jgi:hypothetical protein